jgi:hypothetical protein
MARHAAADLPDEQDPALPAPPAPAPPSPPAVPPLDTKQPSEPLLTRGFLLGGIASVLTLLTAFAVPLSQGQQGAILGVSAFAVPVVLAVIARRKVFSPEAVRRIVRAERRRPNAGPFGGTS